MRRKLLCLFLTLIFVLSVSVVSFAAPEDTASSNPNADPNIVTNLTYEEFAEEDTPAGPVVIPEEEVPLAKTGGIPAGFFYGAGAICIVAAVLVSRKKAESK